MSQARVEIIYVYSVFLVGFPVESLADFLIHSLDSQKGEASVHFHLLNILHFLVYTEYYFRIRYRYGCASTIAPLIPTYLLYFPFDHSCFVQQIEVEHRSAFSGLWAETLSPPSMLGYLETKFHTEFMAIAGHTKLNIWQSYSRRSNSKIRFLTGHGLTFMPSSSALIQGNVGFW